MTVYYLDDLHVGQRFTSGSQVLDEAQIKRFASEFDPQPFHLDEVAAKATVFGGLAASGWHTAAVTMRVLVQDGLPIAGGIIGYGGELSWLKPTRPGRYPQRGQRDRRNQAVALAAKSWQCSCPQ
jgi:acyl dehydratase